MKIRIYSDFYTDEGMLEALRKVLSDSPIMRPYVQIIMRRVDRRTKKQKIEFAVRDVFRALPKTLGTRDLTRACIGRIARDLSKYGLTEPPCDTLTRKTVRKIIEESKSNFSPKVMHHQPSQTYSHTQFSSTSLST